VKMMFDKLLKEDTCFGDVTSETVIPPSLEAQAEVKVKEKCLVAGLNYLKTKIQRLGLHLKNRKQDGETAEKGEVIATIEGNARTILKVERVFLNILGRMCGIATATNRVLSKARRVNPKIRIAATRKTLLGNLDKMAVKLGGGDPHRWSLGDHVLIKDNHVVLVGLEEAVQRARKASFVRKIEVEVKSAAEAIKTAELGVDVIMLDNFSAEEVSEAVTLLKKKGLREKVLLEASGSIDEENVVEYAKTQVDIISMGSLTHSVRSIDIAIDIPLKTTEV
jgi:nicotinate-nucleotide pyrophosphorylase (carboxylating)